MGSRAHVINILLIGATAVLEWGVYAEMLASHAVPLSAVALLVAAFFYGLVGAVQRYPSLLNLPNQDAYDALLQADQQEVIEQCVAPFFYWSAAAWMVTSVLLAGATGAEGIGEGAAIAVTFTSLLLASITDGGLAIYFLVLRAPEKVEELQ